MDNTAQCRNCGSTIYPCPGRSGRYAWTDNSAGTDILGSGLECPKSERGHEPIALDETRRVERGHAFYPTAYEAALIPRVYATEHIPLDAKTLHLHYFTTACDWWIAEYDPESGRAFGYACLNGDALNAEWGSIDLTELESVRVGPVMVERDLHWTPTLARDAKLPGWVPALDPPSIAPAVHGRHGDIDTTAFDESARVLHTAGSTAHRPARLSVGYTVEVLAVVADGEVTRVVVLDEGIRLSGKVYDSQGSEVTGPDADAAVMVAEDNDLAWPSWQFGW